MKLNTALIVVTGLSALTAGVMSIILATMPNEPVSCIKMLKSRAEEVEQKIVLPNQDGGLFLMMQGGQPNTVLFKGYVGPKSADLLKDQMVESGLLSVSVKTEGTCEAESGLVYTVVSGSYIVPPPAPEPI